MPRNKFFKMSLNTKSIDNVIRRLETYKTDTLSKADLFVDKLTKRGISTAKAVFNTAGSGDSDRNASIIFVITSRSGDVIEGRVEASGQDVLFWEFGAGIYYNNGNTHPKAAENGMGVGTYPGQTHAIEPGYWWYSDKDGTHFSVGTEATMPMYKAWLEMKSSVEEVAREVFR